MNELTSGFSHVIMARMIFKIIDGNGWLKGFAIIDFGRRKHVANIFASPLIRHRLHKQISHIEISPIFPVMRVSPCVVLANRREIMLFETLSVNWAISSSVILRRRDELLRGKLRDIMMKGKNENAHMVSIPEHLMTVLRNCD